MKMHVLLFLSIFVISCTPTTIPRVLDNRLPQSISVAQKQIVAVLSGHQNIPSTTLQLAARATIEERAWSRAYLESVLHQIPLTPISQSYRYRNSNPLVDLLVGPYKGTNLYVVLPATKPTKDCIVLGAHYDTARNCPGANDNASAIALLYGVAQKLNSLQQRSTNVMFVFFDQEEEELIGSKAFVNCLKEQHYNIIAAHTFDQIGWDSDNDKAFEIELPSPSLKKQYVSVAATHRVPITITRVNSTDHHSFREAGYEAVGITEGYVQGDTSPYKDTEKDIFETVNFDYLTTLTQLVYDVIKNQIQTPLSHEK
ncbi:M28 family metallopeptidase [Aquimarina brevivitae]|uniref:Peptidase M28-like protein n=1 Tax=Aquimarina brevivitae TaxID=323412 RepID=A0A4Q7PHX0_9FLAO|nr:M28 family peptidase [Aquimarina brevivitae]RZT00157.1 peptidase M28-like protein [Aquimarina brevivitae]